MIVLYLCTIFLSSALLFWIQPLFSKMILPLFGGVPTVWNTSLFFYQFVVLLGYAATHVLIQKIGLFKHGLLHLTLLLLALIGLPVSIAEQYRTSVHVYPLFDLLELLIVSIGLPFFVLSCNSPLIQAWFANTRHRQAVDPYFLYSASNLGSMTALVAFPLALEPALTSEQQCLIWSVVFGMLTILCGICYYLVSRNIVSNESDTAWSNSPWTTRHSADSVTANTRFHWIVLALVPSALLIGVTTHITTDLAAIPLLWIIPLSLYLLSFIIAFARRPIVPHRVVLSIAPYWIAPTILIYLWGASVPILVHSVIHLWTFFILCMVCHGELVRHRPNANQLTEFYFFLSLGGMLGGWMMVFIAPMIFETTMEYPLLLALSMSLLPTEVNPASHRSRKFLYGLIVCLVLLLSGPLFPSKTWMIGIGLLGVSIAASLGSVYALYRFNRPMMWGTIWGLLVLVYVPLQDSSRHILYRDRSFYGTLHVQLDPSQRFRMLYHGTTLHGAQPVASTQDSEPLTYFTRQGPFGDIMRCLHAFKPFARIGITGLGIGAIASYGRPGDEMVYFELDPHIVDIAQDPRYFTYLEHSRAEIEILLGDGRLALGSMPDRYFDILILDAFSSGSIPTHLLTLEAFQLYMSKLKERGWIVFQISNRTLDLEPVLAAAAEAVGWVGYIRDDSERSEEERENLLLPSTWVVLAESNEAVFSLIQLPDWKPVRMNPPIRCWNDSYSNIFHLIKF